MNRPLKFALINLSVNLAFSVYYLVLGIASSSRWLLCLGAYYFILSSVRLVVLERKNNDRFITRFAGWVLMALSITFAKTVILSITHAKAQEFHMIPMIAIAAYSFTKISLATINLIKARRSTSAILITLRNISFADAFVSIFALQRSMLVSFQGMSEDEITIMNATLGSCVFIIILLLGLNLLGNNKYSSKR